MMLSYIIKLDLKKEKIGCKNLISKKYKKFSYPLVYKPNSPVYEFLVHDQDKKKTDIELHIREKYQLKFNSICKEIKKGYIEKHLDIIELGNEIILYYLTGKNNVPQNNIKGQQLELF